MPPSQLYSTRVYPLTRIKFWVIKESACLCHQVTIQQWLVQKYLESVSWSVIIIMISNRAEIVEREPSGSSIKPSPSLQLDSINLLVGQLWHTRLLTEHNSSSKWFGFPARGGRCERPAEKTRRVSRVLNLAEKTRRPKLAEKTRRLIWTLVGCLVSQAYNIYKKLLVS